MPTTTAQMRKVKRMTIKISKAKTTTTTTKVVVEVVIGVVIGVVVGVVVGEIVLEIVGVVMGGVSENEVYQVKNYNYVLMVLIL